jgi:Pyruvate/2-oxoacid:ferredoxin oxidoreductase gamma subunit
MSEVLSPAAPSPHVLVAFNAPSLAKFGPTVRPGGIVIYDSSVIVELPGGLAEGIRVVGVPFADVANELGSVLIKNVVALGALQGVTQLFPKETFLAAIRLALSGKRAMVALNEQAFERGATLAAELVDSVPLSAARSPL